MRDTNLDHLAPVARTAFSGLAAALRRDTIFRLFEGYRSPEAQEMAFQRGTSKAHAFESAHQFGLACDFVPYVDGNWTWAVDADQWRLVAREAQAFGLVCPIAWDPGHVEHPAWRSVRRSTK